jgi:hypothetical protein
MHGKTNIFYNGNRFPNISDDMFYRVEVYTLNRPKFYRPPPWNVFFVLKRNFQVLFCTFIFSYLVYIQKDILKKWESEVFFIFFRLVQTWKGTNTVRDNMLVETPPIQEMEERLFMSQLIRLVARAHSGKKYRFISVNFLNAHCKNTFHPLWDKRYLPFLNRAQDKQYRRQTDI